MNKISFIILNLFISSNLFVFIYINGLIWLLGKQTSFWENFIQLNSLSEFLFIAGCPLILLGLYWIFKINILIFIDKFSKKNSYTYDFFSKFRLDKDFRKKIILTAFFFDMMFILIMGVYYLHRDNFYSITDITNTLIKNILVALGYYILFGMGSLISFLSYNKWIKKH